MSALRLLSAIASSNALDWFWSVFVNRQEIPVSSGQMTNATSTLCLYEKEHCLIAY
jgi:hypothetical protein